MVNGKAKHVVSYMKDFLIHGRAGPHAARQAFGRRARPPHAGAGAGQAVESIAVLDEPTNDLDMETLDVLEDMLTDYPGTVLLYQSRSGFPRPSGGWRDCAGRKTGAGANMPAVTATC